MKVRKQLLELEDNEPQITVGLARMTKKIPEHEFFFKINADEQFNFSRVNDMVIARTFFDYHFARYAGYSKDSKVCIKFIGNKNAYFVRKKQHTELFSEEDETMHLIKNNPEVDYIITSTDEFADFSLLLLPENLVFPIQNLIVEPDDELYDVIQYYE